MNKTLAEQGPSTPALATIFKYEFRLTKQSLLILKCSHYRKVMLRHKYSVITLQSRLMKDNID